MRARAKDFSEKYPFWSGILIGFIVCLALIGLINGFSARDVNGFRDANQILKEDYLRLSVNDYAFTRNEARAKWRYQQFGKEGSALLGMMKKDPLTDPLSLLQFSQVVGDYSLIAPEIVNPSASTKVAAGGAEKSGPPLIGVIFWIILVLALAALLVIFFLSDRGKQFVAQVKDFFGELKFKQPAFLNRDKMNTDAEPAQRAQASRNDENRFSERITDTVMRSESRGGTDFQLTELKDFDDWDSDSSPVEEADIVEEPLVGGLATFKADADSPELDLKFTDDDLDEVEPKADADADADEREDELYDPEEEALSDDLELADKLDQDEEEYGSGQPFDLTLDDSDDEDFEDLSDETIDESADSSDDAAGSDAEASGKAGVAAGFEERTAAASMDPLIHYQTVYKLGDDFFDETFSLDDAEEKFIGECGIGIAETINNTDPKAVTAFEIWLFDREDVQTPTHFLLSDFAYSNDQMMERLKNKGRFDLIELNQEYEVVAHSLRMIVTVTELEYGAGGIDKRSYFNKVAFDVKVWQI